MLLLLLVQEPHFQNHCPKGIGLKSMHILLPYKLNDLAKLALQHRERRRGLSTRHPSPHPLLLLRPPPQPKSGS